VIRATKINDFKGITQKLLRLQDGLWQIGRVAFWAKNWFDPCRAHHPSSAEPLPAVGHRAITPVLIPGNGCSTTRDLV
jgi:hypothetical protein